MSIVKAETVEYWEWQRGDRQQDYRNAPVTYRWTNAFESGFNSEADAHVAAKRYADGRDANYRSSAMVYRVVHVITQRAYGEQTTWPAEDGGDG